MPSRASGKSLLIALFLSGCSNAVEKPPNEILCAAEALHQARNVAPSRAAEDSLRARADVFTRKLPVEKRQRFWTQIDQLSDKRGTQPLVPASTCEALLTDQDRRALAESAGDDAKTHQ